MGFRINKKGILEKYTEEPGVTEVIIPDSVTSIGDRAFGYCERLKTVTIPDSGTSIGKSAFSHCTSLTSVTIPNSVTSIGESAFNYCTRLTNVTIPDGVTSIRRCAFYGCKSMTNVTIPNSVTSIGDWAFAGCSCLSSVTIPDSVTSIGTRAFADCSSFTSVNIPDSVSYVGKDCFESTPFYQNDSREMIMYGRTIHKYRGSEETVIIPENVMCITENAFEGCSSIKTIIFEGKLPKIERNALNTGSNVSVILHKSYIKEWKDRANIKVKDVAASYMKEYCSGYCFDEEIVSGNNAWISKNKEIILNAFPDTPEVVEYMVKAKIIGSESVISPVEQIVLKDHKVPDLMLELKNIYGLKEKGIPELKDCNKNKAAPYVLAYLLTATLEELRIIIPQIDHSSLRTAFGKIMSNPKVADRVLYMVRQNLLLWDDFFTPVEQAVLNNHNVANMMATVNYLFGMKEDEVHALTDSNGKKAAPFVLAYLLSMYQNDCQEVLSMIDQRSLQLELRGLTQVVAAYKSGNKKHKLAYPILRYGDEETAGKLISSFVKRWSRKGMFGIYQEPFEIALDAALYSDTNAAVFFVDKYGSLERYANLRETDADTYRDMYLSDVGLDKDGGKEYDLGNQKVTARLQPDLTFLFELENGKTAKSLPKKGADSEKYEAVKEDFSAMKKKAKKILTNRFNRLFEDFLDGKRSRNAADWQKAYLNNPLLMKAARIIVWAQVDKTFILSDDGIIDSSESSYTLTDDPIYVAHPLDMTDEDVLRWQKYFTVHVLKQPFAQIWEPVHFPENIKNDRYEGFTSSVRKFMYLDRHGIHVSDPYSDFVLYLKDGVLKYKCVKYDDNDPTESLIRLGDFQFKKYDRIINHIINVLDNITFEQLLEKRVADDEDAFFMERVNDLTLAQITNLIELAGKYGAVKIMALLLEHKRQKYSDFDPMDEFVLDW